MWETGTFIYNGRAYYYEAKVYDEGSQFGINGGRVSKLFCKCEEGTNMGGGVILQYDRGWYHGAPRAKYKKEILEIILAKYPVFK